ncbi:hypothetical protein ACH5RR_014470 [Cinchona calisaya]|uniref:Uncharacterized protein n=1 Tax=Cinchona calisaya TaxID=153742 RepID=A0ABD3A8S2_9GENT
MTFLKDRFLASGAKESSLWVDQYASKYWLRTKVARKKNGWEKFRYILEEIRKNEIGLPETLHKFYVKDADYQAMRSSTGTEERKGQSIGQIWKEWTRKLFVNPNSSLNLPSSTRTVWAQTDVEAFALGAEALKILAIQFKSLHSKKLQHAFRYRSIQWWTWGACSLYKPLGEGLGGGYLIITLSIHLRATIMASQFAANPKEGADISNLKMPKLSKADEHGFLCRLGRIVAQQQKEVKTLINY